MNGSASNQSEHLNGKYKQIDKQIDAPSHRPLTLFRKLRGILCLIIILTTAFSLLVYYAPVSALIVRLFSVNSSRKLTSFLFGMWLSLWPFLFEKINQTKLVFSGEKVPDRERVLLFANHRTEVDWMYLWDLALRKGRLGQIKYILKSSLMKIPVFGWAFHVMEFIPVERKWEIDEQIIRARLRKFRNPRDPLWLAVFPEGTDYTEEKCIKSQEYAAENGLPVLKNVLLPKTKGFIACLEELRDSLDAVYDVTIAYKYRLPIFLNNVFGTDPSEVHIHINRILIKDIPKLEDEAADWLIERFRLKDQLLSDFTNLGYFPNQGTEGELSTPICVLNCLTVIAVTCLFLYCTFFLSKWFVVYVALSCVYLSTVTKYGIEIPELLGFVNEKKKI